MTTAPTATPAGLAPVLERIDAGLDDSIGRLFDILRIPSISTDPKFKDEVRRGAEWMRAVLEELGFEASVRPTAGHPMVIGRYDGPAGAPRLLYYGHYDVQPPDPLDLWTSPPFEPHLVEAERGKRIVARGAVDDKGQVMTFLEAFRAWREVHGGYPVSITVMLEGEEETGSPSLLPFIEANADELAADACVVCDTGMWTVDQPAISYALRGMTYLEATVTGPNRDLHSGMYGGGVINPLNLLSRVLGNLHDETGRVTVPGFYDDVIPVGENEKAQWDALGFDEKAFLGDIGLDPESAGGEKGYSALERLWARPTLDVNGIYGGYTDPGAKTVIAAQATAKISCRLVADQDPRRILDALKAHIEAQLPKGYSVAFTELGCAPAVRVPTDSRYLGAALTALRDEYGRDAVLIGCGGSIPAVGAIHSVLGIDSILMGFGLEDDRVHSPNEKFELVCFHRGIRSNAALLARVAELSS
jgi:acetylornithine deacetylase/succinyl-diaminopimelate desuccinylase-like protein